jgi:hypothetical protein
MINHLRTYRLVAPLVAIILMLGLAGAGVARDIHSDAGTSAFPFLKIHVSARAVAMGGAFTGLADDASSLYYNPAGLVSSSDMLILGYHNYVADLQSGFVGYVKPLDRDRQQALGFYFSYLNYGELLETDGSGQILDEFSAGDLLFGVTYARQMDWHWSLGATGKFIYSSAHDYSATGLALDAGVKYTADRDRWSAGLVVQNLGVQVSAFGDQTDRLPLTLRLGGAVHPRGLPLVVAADIVAPIDNDIYLAVGAEYLKLQPLFIRLGWNGFGVNYRAENSNDNLAGFSGGAGFVFDKFQISYAFSPQADLGDSHRITLTRSL